MAFTRQTIRKSNCCVLLCSVIPAGTGSRPQPSCQTVAQWKERVFVPALLSGMERSRFAAAAGDCRSLAICDKAIDAALASDLANASRAAGAALMEKYLPPKTERLWMRYRSLQSSGEVPGHLAVVCAVRAVAFHLSPWAMLSAYVFLEAKAGLPRDGFASWVNMVADCLTARQSPKSSDLRAA